MRKLFGTCAIVFVVVACQTTKPSPAPAKETASQKLSPPPAGPAPALRKKSLAQEVSKHNPAGMKLKPDSGEIFGPGGLGLGGRKVRGLKDIDD